MEGLVKEWRVVVSALILIAWIGGIWFVSMEAAVITFVCVIILTFLLRKRDQ